MEPEETPVGTVLPPGGQAQPPLRVDQPERTVGNGFLHDEQPAIVVNGDESAIKHPVDGRAQCQAVPHAVRPIVLDRADVGGLGLRSASAIDDPEAADRACFLYALLTPAANTRSRKGRQDTCWTTGLSLENASSTPDPPGTAWSCRAAETHRKSGCKDQAVLVISDESHGTAEHALVR